MAPRLTAAKCRWAYDALVRLQQCEGWGHWGNEQDIERAKNTLSRIATRLDAEKAQGGEE